MPSKPRTVTLVLPPARLPPAAEAATARNGGARGGREGALAASDARPRAGRPCGGRHDLGLELRRGRAGLDPALRLPSLEVQDHPGQAERVGPGAHPVDVAQPLDRAVPTRLEGQI